jgi:hypothetical protein
MNKRVTANIPLVTLQKARAIVIQHAEISFSGLVTQGLNHMITLFERKRGRAYKPTKQLLKPGRLKKPVTTRRVTANR